MDYYDIEHTANVVVSYVVLHNICEQLGDVCHPEWIHDIDDSLVPSSAVTTGSGSNANNIRNALKQYVYKHQ